VIKPIGERVLVEGIKVEKKTKSGLILPGVVSDESSNRGRVIALGQGDRLKELTLDNTVIYKNNSGVEIKEEDRKYLLLNIEDILAVVE